MPYYAYVSLQDDDKILVFTMEAGTGKLTLKESVPVSGGPAALAIDPGRNYLCWNQSHVRARSRGGGRVWRA